MREVYNALRDDASKAIFKHRLLFSLLNDRKEIAEMICGINPLYKSLFDASEKKICLYGAGGGCCYVIEEIIKRNTFRLPFVIDNYKKGEICGYPIITFEDFLKMPDCKEYLIIVTVGKTGIREEITRNLSNYDLRYCLAYFDVAYFDLAYFDYSQEEYFVDAGALNGDTTKEFFRICPNGHSYLFEPNPVQYEISKENLKNYPNATFFPYGLWNENAALRFTSNDMTGEAGACKISDHGDIEVQVRALDDMLKGKKVTFIKMDIEGAELNALKGAENIIKEQKPKLAISVYHKPQDIWEIPKLILDFVPGYKLYLRHYSFSNTETVLYAIYQENGLK